MTMISTEVLVLLLLLSPGQVYPVKKSGCELPVSWRGIWFQQGVRPYITITQDRVSSKGVCRARSQGHVLLERRTGHQPCYTCLVFHITHTNLIHYKETLTCSSGPEPELASLCRTIPGDAPLYTLFRVDATSIRCPVQGPQLFSYDFGRGSCRSPMSSLESCTISTRISLKYQACPNVPGTEMKETQFECLASWREGRNNFLVGKMEHTHISKDEERFRCILWSQELVEGEMKTFMSLSGDASCNGLYSSREGQVLVVSPVSKQRLCSLPSWLRHGKVWQSLDMKLKLEISQGQDSSPSISVTRGEEVSSSSGRYYSAVETSRMVCSLVTHLSQDLQEIRMVMHETRGCSTGYVCSSVRGLSSTVMELRLGRMSVTQEYACDKEYFNDTTKTFTLVGGPHSACPLNGLFSVSIKQSDFSLAVKPGREAEGWGTSEERREECLLEYSIQAGCGQHDHRDLTWAACHNGVREVSRHQCVTQWTRHNTSFFITHMAARSQYSCYSYTTHQQTNTVMMLGTQCRQGHVNSFPFNISRQGDCLLLSPASLAQPSLLLLSFSLLR